MADNRSKVERTITAENQFTDALIMPRPAYGDSARFNVSVAATAISATVTLQRMFPGDSAWRDVKTYTAAVEETVEEAGGVHYRIGVKTGGFTSATALVVGLRA
jgi:hypothetical protein